MQVKQDKDLAEFAKDKTAVVEIVEVEGDLQLAQHEIVKTSKGRIVVKDAISGKQRILGFKVGKAVRESIRVAFDQTDALSDFVDEARQRVDAARAVLTAAEERLSRAEALQKLAVEQDVAA